MKTATIGLLGLAVFGGVLGALQANKHLEQKQLQTDSMRATANAPVQPVMFEGLAQTGGSIDFRNAVKKVNPSVVSVDRFNRVRTNYFDNTLTERETGSGSGVILSSSGLIVTNNHVVERAGRVSVRLADNRTFDAKVLGTDPRSDLAVLKIEAPNLKPIEVGSSKDLQPGQWVLAIGNPLGFENTVSVGVVSSVNRNLPVGREGLVNAIQTDAAINPGNSGGALADQNGRLVGINSAIASGTGQSVGIGFAIPVDRMKQVVDDIVKHGYAKYAGLGVSYNGRFDGAFGDPNFRAEFAELVATENVPTKGIWIQEATGAAARAGLQKNDVILAINDVEVNGTFDLNKALIPHKPGDTVTVRFWSKGQTRTARVTLQEVVRSQPL